MIVVAGLSPAWQQVLVFEELQAGEVNRAAAAYWCASGKVLNVAVVLSQLSADAANQSLAITTVGGAALEPMDRDLERLGVARRWIPTAAPTRVCTTVVDRSAGIVTELVENAGAISPNELRAFASAFSEAAATASTVVLTGSVPSGVPPDFFATLLAGARATAILDLRGPELLATLQRRPAVVKPNRAELAATLGSAIATDDDLRGALAELLARGARSVVVTAGREAIWTASSEGVRRFTPPEVDRAVSSIGCGDAFAAGLAWTLDRGGRLDEAVERGMAAAAASLRTLLPGDLDGRRERIALR